MFVLKYNKWISLDISTNTGFAIFNGSELDTYGLITVKVPEYKSDIKKFSDFPKAYPYNFLEASLTMANQIKDLLAEEKIEYVVMEHTEKGKQRLSQRILEWFHFAIVKMLVDQSIPFSYILVSDWRKEVKCYLSCWPEYTAFNKQVKAAKKIATPTKTGRKTARIDGKRVSKMDFKKLSIIIANKKYGLEITDDNIADAINIGTASSVLI